ncbi:MAG: hypothetical protein KGZ83_03655, partial [Sulfuricella sp.]|nr:hypothetical protein [Sulfuricella sp.]
TGAHLGYEQARACLQPEIDARDAGSELLLRALCAQGQAFLSAAIEVLERPETQEVVSRTLNAIGRYFAHAQDSVPLDADKVLSCHSCRAARDAVLRLAGSSEQIVWQVFTRSTAIGSLMRRKIEPVMAPLLADMRLLCSATVCGMPGNNH